MFHSQHTKKELQAPPHSNIFHHFNKKSPITFNKKTETTVNYFYSLKSIYYRVSQGFEKKIRKLIIYIKTSNH